MLDDSWFTRSIAAVDQQINQTKSLLVVEIENTNLSFIYSEEYDLVGHKIREHVRSSFKVVHASCNE